MTLKHDNNGPFVSYARGSSEAREEEPRTETVYAIEVVSSKRGTLYWNARTEPFSDDDLRAAREDAYRFSRSLNYGAIFSVTRVASEVSISRTPWTSTEPSE